MVKVPLLQVFHTETPSQGVSSLPLFSQSREAPSGSVTVTQKWEGRSTQRSLPAWHSHHSMCP